MHHTLPLSANAASSAESLRRLGRLELKAFFRSLSAPTLQEMRGEYKAELLDQGGHLARLIIHALFHTNGKWTGKAFAPTTGAEGMGYNTFQRRDRTIQRFPMRTHLALGKCGRRNSLYLEYATLNSGLLRTMVDEVRRVASGVYLGFGVVGPTPKLQRKIPFLLTGPVRGFAPAPSITSRVYQVRAQPRFSCPSPA